MALVVLTAFPVGRYRAKMRYASFITADNQDALKQPAAVVRAVASSSDDIAVRLAGSLLPWRAHICDDYMPTCPAYMKMSRASSASMHKNEIAEFSTVRGGRAC
jgi:hypothetical protein